MKRVLSLGILGLALILAGGAAAEAAAQVAVSPADIQRLQDRVYDAGGDISRVRARNADAASRLQIELDELREEVIYLKVKLRKEGAVSRAEYSDLRDRIDQVASRARGDATMTTGGTPAPAAQPSVGHTGMTPQPGTTTTGAQTGTQPGAQPGAQTGTRTSTAAADIPVGTELDIRLQTTLNSGTARVEQRFEGTTVADVQASDGRVLIPAGSIVRGVVSDVRSAGRVDRKAAMTLSFDQITIRGRAYPMRGTLAPFEGEGVRGDAAKIGTGAGVGAVIGGILGGFKGALAGILIGGGGVVAATEGQEVNLPAGTVLRIRFDTPLELR
jgi:TolA-binding protein